MTESQAPFGIVGLVTVSSGVAECLAASCITDSTTVWKTTHGKPVDFTLKKRYLVGQLDEA